MTAATVTKTAESQEVHQIIDRLTYSAIRQIKGYTEQLRECHSVLKR